jgi:hypothetical protein
MQIFSDELRDRFRHKPISSTLLAILAVAAFAVIGEFSVGFVDGLIEGFTDGL